MSCQSRCKLRDAAGNMFVGLTQLVLAYDLSRIGYKLREVTCVRSHVADCAPSMKANRRQ